MTRQTHIANVLGVALLTMLVACGDDTSEQPTPISPLDPNQEHFGRSYDEWGCAWWEWVTETPYTEACDFTVFDTDGSQCAAGQDPASDVFFLAGTVSGDSITRDKCSIPAGKTLLFPILNGMFDNAGLPPEQVQTVVQVEEAAADYLSAIDQASLFVTVDGEELVDLPTYDIGPVACPYELPPEPNFYTCAGLPGIVGLIDPAFATGYYVMLPPLDAGTHTIRFGGKTSPPNEFELDVTYELTVE